MEATRKYKNLPEKRYDQTNKSSYLEYEEAKKKVQNK